MLRKQCQLLFSWDKDLLDDQMRLTWNWICAAERSVTLFSM